MPNWPSREFFNSLLEQTELPILRPLSQPLIPLVLHQFALDIRKERREANDCTRPRQRRCDARSRNSRSSARVMPT